MSIQFQKICDAIIMTKDEERGCFINEYVDTFRYSAIEYDQQEDLLNMAAFFLQCIARLVQSRFECAQLTEGIQTIIGDHQTLLRENLLRAGSESKYENLENEAPMYIKTLDEACSILSKKMQELSESKTDIVEPDTAFKQVFLTGASPKAYNAVKVQGNMFRIITGLTIFIMRSLSAQYDVFK